MRRFQFQRKPKTLRISTRGVSLSAYLAPFSNPSTGEQMSKWWRAAAGAAKNTQEAKFYRSYYTIQAVPREIVGHRIAVRERAQGRVPAVVLSQDYVRKNPSDPTSVTASSSVSRKLLLTTERKQILTILERVKAPFFCSTTFPLQIRAGPGSDTIIDKGRVLPIKLHRDGDGKIMNLVFVWAEDGTELMVDVPIVYKGEDSCPGLEKGGRLSKIRASLKYLSPAEHIPPKIEVDVSNLDIGDSISMHEIAVRSSLKLLSKNANLPVCKIMPTYTETNWISH